MKRLFVVAIVLIAGYYSLSAQVLSNIKDISEFNKLTECMKNQDSLEYMRVPGIFRNMFRKEIIKSTDKEDDDTREKIKTMTQGIEDIYMVSYAKCDKNFIDSLDNVMISMLNDKKTGYDRNICYVYGFAECKDTLGVILMHVASSSAIIYMKGKFPIL